MGIQHKNIVDRWKFAAPF